MYLYIYTHIAAAAVTTVMAAQLAGVCTYTCKCIYVYVHM